MSMSNLANEAEYIAMLALAKKCLDNPLLLNQMGDRVYAIFLEDMRCQRDRMRNYGKERWL
uniref:Uncharacterized protein n=4 Tax=Nostocales TaxID=1161 RepID=A0A0C1QTZ0_9CYAN